MNPWADWNNTPKTDVPVNPAPASGKNPWDDWTGGGGGGNSNPIPSAVRCAISYDTKAAQVTLPEAVKEGTSFLAFTGVDGGTKAKLPSALFYELLDAKTVLVTLTGTGDTVTGPEYTPPAWPGGKPKPKPVPKGTPYVVVLVVPPPGQGM